MLSGQDCKAAGMPKEPELLCPVVQWNFFSVAKLQTLWTEGDEGDEGDGGDGGDGDGLSRSAGVAVCSMAANLRRDFVAQSTHGNALHLLIGCGMGQNPGEHPRSEQSNCWDVRPISGSL